LNLFPLIAGPETRAEPIYYTETGGMRTCAKLAGIDLEDFRKLSRKANILVVVQATSIRGRTSKSLPLSWSNQDFIRCLIIISKPPPVIAGTINYNGRCRILVVSYHYLYER